jgi:hypothetical protein
MGGDTVWDSGCGKVCPSWSHGVGNPVQYFQRESSCSPLGHGFPDQRLALQWLGATLCACLKSMGELGNQFDFSFETWISYSDIVVHVFCGNRAPLSKTLCGHRDRKVSFPPCPGATEAKQRGSELSRLQVQVQEWVLPWSLSPAPSAEPGLHGDRAGVAVTACEGGTGQTLTERNPPSQAGQPSCLHTSQSLGRSYFCFSNLGSDYTLFFSLCIKDHLLQAPYSVFKEYTVTESDTC